MPIPVNHNKPWTPSQINRLAQLANQNTPTKEIASELGRTEAAIRSQASLKKIPLMPKDK